MSSRILPRWRWQESQSTGHATIARRTSLADCGSRHQSDGCLSVVAVAVEGCVLDRVADRTRFEQCIAFLAAPLRAVGLASDDELGRFPVREVKADGFNDSVYVAIVGSLHGFGRRCVSGSRVAKGVSVAPEVSWRLLLRLGDGGRTLEGFANNERRGPHEVHRRRRRAPTGRRRSRGGRVPRSLLHHRRTPRSARRRWGRGP